jgi:type IV pilus biogenesis protein CpaD/CtpE
MRRVILAVAVLTLAGCAKDINNKDAVKTAIMKRVSKTGFDVKAMKVDITQVSFHDQDAVATVSFVPNAGPPEAAVTFKYNLHRQNDEWVATGLAQGGGMAAHGGAPSGPNPHGGTMPGGAMPGGSLPGSMSAPAPANGLPSGHPPLGQQQ